MGSYIISLHLTEKARRTNEPQDNQAARKARNQTNRLLKSAKNNFIKEKLNDYRNNPKKFWEQIKSTYPTDKNQNPIRLSDTEGNILNNNQTATLVNEYFTNIGPDLANTARNMVRNLDLPILNAQINQICASIIYSTYGGTSRTRVKQSP